MAGKKATTATEVLKPDKVDTFSGQKASGFSDTVDEITSKIASLQAKSPTGRQGIEADLTKEFKNRGEERSRDFKATVDGNRNLKNRLSHNIERGNKNREKLVAKKRLQMAMLAMLEKQQAVEVAAEKEKQAHLKDDKDLFSDIDNKISNLQEDISGLVQEGKDHFDPNLPDDSYDGVDGDESVVVAGGDSLVGGNQGQVDDVFGIFC